MDKNRTNAAQQKKTTALAETFKPLCFCEKGTSRITKPDKNARGFRAMKKDLAVIEGDQ